MNKNLTKIAVIMPSYLGDYEGASKNREDKFIRAVQSFLDNNYPEKYLIIVADGCDITYQIYSGMHKYNNRIKCVQIPKQPLFSGMVRQHGLDYQRRHIKADIETYLDSDDYIHPEHLTRIVNSFKSEDNLQDLSYDWIYCNDILKSDKLQMRSTSLQHGQIGTSNISHRALKDFNWKNCNGYGHDWTFISTKLMKNRNFRKIEWPGYYVCHNPNLFDN